MDTYKFYSRKDIQKELVRIAKNREVGIKYGDKGFGPRPDMLQFEGDIIEYLRKGATSFHFSEERWFNPLELKPGLSKQKMDELRLGWDLILDIDCNYLEYSKKAAFLLVEALKFYDIKNFSIKFSGRSGFHLALPFESFPSKVNNVNTKLLFPEGTRVIASHLKDLIKEPLAAEILSINKLDEIIKITGKKKEELLENNKFNPFSVLDIDSVLISSRHLFRAPYSFNEKSGFVSIPVDPEKVKDFDIQQASPEKINIDISFLDISKIKEPEASQLITQAFDWASKTKRFVQSEELNKFKKTELPAQAIKEEFFPPCIKNILNGLPIDGRKRSIFVLINFLRHMGWSFESIESRLLEWNKKNYEPLREGYILAQVSWSKRQNKLILPPNCDNESYYKSFGVCNPASFCSKIKNPVNQTRLSLNALNQNKKSKT